MEKFIHGNNSLLKIIDKIDILHHHRYIKILNKILAHQYLKNDNVLLPRKGRNAKKANLVSIFKNQCNSPE